MEQQSQTILGNCVYLSEVLSFFRGSLQLCFPAAMPLFLTEMAIQDLWNQYLRNTHLCHTKTITFIKFFKLMDNYNGSWPDLLSMI